MKKELGQDYVVLLRTHHYIADKIDVSGLEDFAFNVSKYDDITEIYLISDICITDYSSVFFDFANLKRPMLFYTYDIDKYRDVLRGFYIDMEKELPGPLVYTTQEIVDQIKNIDEIIEASDGIMVARGDLGVEMPMKELPILQKEIIEKCRKRGRTVIVATEMLASMYTSSRPTRAEISDVANAVLDGTDAVMLSGETTVGKHPAEAVRYMAETCEEAEEYYNYAKQKSYAKENSIPSAIAHNVVESANLLDVKVIIAATTSGYTAKIIGTLKPKSQIVAACPNEKVARSLALNYGVHPIIVKYYEALEDLIYNVKEETNKAMNLQKGDIVIITGGFPTLNKVKTTNFLKIDTI